MSTDWTAFDFQTKLAAQVTTAITAAALDPPEPRVLTYFPSPDESLTDTVVIGHVVSDTKEQVTLAAENARHDEEVTLECVIRVMRHGAGEDTAKAARDRAVVLLAVVDDEVRSNKPKVGNQTLSANISSRTGAFFPWITQEGAGVREALIEFDITYRARTSTS